MALFLFACQWQGMLTAIINQASISSTLSYNAAGDMSSMMGARGVSTNLAYDAADRLTSVEVAIPCAPPHR